MNQKSCTFCANDKAYEQSCDECAKSIFYCDDCYGVKSTLCPECSAASITSCHQCRKDLTKVPEEELVIIRFKKCKDKTKKHALSQCKDCANKVAKALLDQTSTQKHCFLCFVDLKKGNLLYYEEPLGCEEGHKAKLCSLCHDIFNPSKDSCPICKEFDLTKPHCAACFKPGKFTFSVLPMACIESGHKFPMCFDCSGRIKKPQFACKYCCAKREKNFFFNKLCRKVNGDVSLMGVKFISNKIHDGMLVVDPIICPFCEPLTVQPYLLSDSIQMSEENAPFFLGSATCQTGSSTVLTGGFNVELGQSSNETAVVHFNIDGRLRDYSWSFFQPLLKARHAHGSCFYEPQSTLVVFGGINKTGLNTIEYLDSIEFCKFDVKQAQDTPDAAWSSVANCKLTKPRAHFSHILVGEDVYVFGGISALNTIENTFEAINLRTKKCLDIPFTLKDSVRLPTKPALYLNSSKQIIIFGGLNEKNEKSNHVIQFELNTRECKQRIGKVSLFSSIAPVYYIRAFEEHIAFAGQYFGPAKPELKDVQFKYRLLETQQEEVIVDSKIDGLEHGEINNQNFTLFGGSEVEFRIK